MLATFALLSALALLPAFALLAALALLALALLPLLTFTLLPLLSAGLLAGPLSQSPPGVLVGARLQPLVERLHVAHHVPGAVE